VAKVNLCAQLCRKMHYAIRAPNLSQLESPKSGRNPSTVAATEMDATWESAGCTFGSTITDTPTANIYLKC